MTPVHEDTQTAWWKPVLLAMIVPAAGFAVGYGMLESRVRGIDREVQEKANREVVAAEYRAIQTQLELMREEIRAMNTDLKAHMRMNGNGNGNGTK